MRRSVALGLAGLLALGAWIGIGAAVTEPWRSQAEAQSPPIEIHATQDASFLPTERNKPIFILAIGSDARPGEKEEDRLADSIHLIGVNPKEGAGTILGFPRDSYVSIPGVGDRKINDALFNGGPELVVEAIQNLTGITIDYYLLTGFDGFKKLVSGIGGLKVEVPYPMNDSNSGAVFEAGVTSVDGAEALAFARNRYDTPQGDFSRSENHGILILSALKKLRTSFEKDPGVIFEWIAVGMSYVKTDLSFDQIFDLTLTALQIAPAKMANAVVPGGTANVGGASVVVLAENAGEIYEDLADDAILENVPPSANLAPD